MISIADQEIGFHQCEQNAHISLLEAHKLFQEGHFRHSAFFSIIALEEIGKGYFLLESFEAGNPITEANWRDHDSFFGHLPKMRKASAEFVARTQREIHDLFPGIPIKTAVLGFTPNDIRVLWNLRNRLLFVDYHFRQQKWVHPQQLQNLSDEAYECFNKALSTFNSLEDALHEKGYDTIKRFE